MFRPTLLLPLLLCLPLLRAAEPAAPEDTTFAKTNAKIAALFQDRDRPPSLPADLQNPFSLLNERSASDDASSTGAQINLSTRELLARLALTIQVNGIVVSGGRHAVIIGKKPFNEGDAVSLSYAGATFIVTIKHITGETFTIAYKDAELALRLAH